MVDSGRRRGLQRSRTMGGSLKTSKLSLFKILYNPRFFLSLISNPLEGSRVRMERYKSYVRQNDIGGVMSTNLLFQPCRELKRLVKNEDGTRLAKNGSEADEWKKDEEKLFRKRLKTGRGQGWSRLTEERDDRANQAKETASCRKIVIGHQLRRVTQEAPVSWKRLQETHGSERTRKGNTEGKYM